MIGVFAYQGSCNLFIEFLPRLGLKVEKIDITKDLMQYDGIIMPGGESSAQYKFCKENGVFSKILHFAKSVRPILGVCAGAILLSKITTPLVKGIGLVNMDIERNTYGSQIHSDIKKSDDNQEIAFIRAPKFTKLGKEVSIIQTYKQSPIFIQQNNVFCTAYHPELSPLNTNNPIYRIFKK